MNDSVESRMERERAKAVEKYGAVALAPGGHPDYDIIDYAINEIVGLHRYGEMLGYRALENPQWPEPHREFLVSLAMHLQSVAVEVGNQMISTREELLSMGHNLGKPETR